MRKILASIDASDVLALIGLATAGYGIYLISLPAALIVVGAVLFLLGIFTSLPGRKDKK